MVAQRREVSSDVLRLIAISLRWTRKDCSQCQHGPCWCKVQVLYASPPQAEREEDKVMSVKHDTLMYIFIMADSVRLCVKLVRQWMVWPTVWLGKVLMQTRKEISPRAATYCRLTCMINCGRSIWTNLYIQNKMKLIRGGNKKRKRKMTVFTFLALWRSSSQHASYCAPPPTRPNCHQYCLQPHWSHGSILYPLSLTFQTQCFPFI